MRKLMISAALAAALAACSPPAQHDTTTPTPTPRPTALTCNNVAPDASKQVRVEDEVAVAAAAADLRGGRIAPGTYDLTSARRIGAATGWTGTHAVALEVSESASGGVIFNWAGAAPSGPVDTWTATFTDTPQPRLAYSCGRMGEVDADFSANATQLELRLPDGADGRLNLVFAKRG